MKKFISRVIRDLRARFIRPARLALVVIRQNGMVIKVSLCRMCKNGTMLPFLDFVCDDMEEAVAEAQEYIRRA